MPSDLRSVLVTGGGGFVGSFVVEQLLDDKTASNPPEVAVLSRSPKVKDARARYHKVDINDKAAITALIAQLSPEVIIHTACPDPRESLKVLHKANVEGTETLLQAAQQNPATKAFVYTSSERAIEPQRGPKITEAESKQWTATHWDCPYGRSKALAERLVMEANGSDLRTACLRLPAVYGETSKFSRGIIEAIQRKETRVQVGSNKRIFEHVYVRSAAQAHILAAKLLVDEYNEMHSLPAASHAGILDSNQNRSGYGYGYKTKDEVQVTITTIPRQLIGGEAFFISDGVSQPFFRFSRACFAAAGHYVSESEVRCLPVRFMQCMASLADWAYFIFTLDTKRPERVSRMYMNYFAGGSHWDIGKARRLLGYEPVPQPEAIERSVQWALNEYALGAR